MKVSIVGTGYVGLVTGACLADMGNDVLCLDLDAGKIAALQSGRIPIFEPGLEPIVRRNRDAGRLGYSTDIAASVAHGELQMIAVGTPPDEDGSADLQHVIAAARSIGRLMTGYRVIVNKSTVPVGTADKVRQAVAEELAARGSNVPFSVVSNPEFLKEGAAVEDFMRPDRIIVGSDDERATEMLRRLYAPFQRNRERFMAMGVRSAELTKYAANAMLATRISFMNELANLAERIGADIEEVRRGIGADPRIGFQFLHPGPGYGGSCFPKDVAALLHISSTAGYDFDLLAGVVDVNAQQHERIVEKVRAGVGGNLAGATIGVWGLTFKADTDDLRDSPAIYIARRFVEEGAIVRAYDPGAGERPRQLVPGLELCVDVYDAAVGADAVALLTEWDEFRWLDFERVGHSMQRRAIVDTRNLLDPAAIRRQGFAYRGVGR